MLPLLTQNVLFEYRPSASDANAASRNDIGTLSASSAISFLGNDNVMFHSHSPEVQ